MSEETLEEELEQETEDQQAEPTKEVKKGKKKKKDEISELEEKCAELNDKYLYALAQMKDLHKTYEKENAISVKYVTYDLMEELLPIIDIFSMVLSNKNVPKEVAGYLQGFELVFNQFKQILEKHGVEEIKTNVGDKFDHNIHNGVEKVEIEEDQGEDDTIAEVMQKGYRIGDKILRPVSVKVFSVKKEDIKDEQTEDTNDNESQEAIEE